jgi:hypothetical protein
MRVIVVDSEESKRDLLREAIRTHPIVGYYGSFESIKCSRTIGSIPNDVDIVVLDGLVNDGPAVYKLFRELSDERGYETHVIGWSADERYISNPRLLGDTFVPKADLQKLLAHIDEVAELLALAKAQ